VNYQQTLDYIYSFVNYETLPQPRDKAHFDLRRMEEVLSRLGNPHRLARTVHIAGTNGKGSVAAMVASVLVASGYRTGLYTSPHLERLEERIRVNGRLISEAELIGLVEQLEPEVEAVNAKATYGRLTTFEVLTALAFAYFRQQEVDFQVVEVGLGGRLDATNVVSPGVAIITSVSFDHRDVLGDSLSQIAGEKAGIIKPESRVVSSPQASEVLQVIKEVCAAAGADLIRVGADVSWRGTGFDLAGQSLLVRGRLGSYELTIPLLGEHQLENAATAVAALEVLTEAGATIPKQDIAGGLARVSWPGRLEVLHRQPLVLLDGAHNPDSARKLKQAIGEYFSFKRAYLIIGASIDKDVGGVAAELVPLFDEVILTRAKHPRAAVPESIARDFRGCGARLHLTQNVVEALSLALALAGPDDLICASGSLFVVAEAAEAARQLLA